jgi:Arc/MetJ family transcription regulator
MRTTLDIDADLLDQVMQVTGANTKRKAFEIALREFLRGKQRQELSDLIGNYEDFTLSLDDLEQMRHGR